MYVGISKPRPVGPGRPYSPVGPKRTLGLGSLRLNAQVL